TSLDDSQPNPIRPHYSTNNPDVSTVLLLPGLDGDAIRKALPVARRRDDHFIESITLPVKVGRSLGFLAKSERYPKTIKQEKMVRLQKWLQSRIFWAVSYL